MKRAYLLLLGFFGVTAIVTAQQYAPVIEWQKCLGGSADDRPEVVLPTADNGFIIVGYTSSSNGDVTGYHGGATDGWVVKISSTGTLVWQKTYGGSGDEYFRNIAATSDGNYAIAGYTTSNDGDVSGNHGATDMWVIKIDPAGNLLWQKTLGGTARDEASSLTQFSDGTLWVIGKTYSNNGDVSGLHNPTSGWEDAWVVKLANSNGTLLSQRCFGGDRQDWGLDILESDNGNFIISAVVYSDDGDFGTHSGNPPPCDVIKVNPANTMIWKTGTQRTNSRYLSRKGDQVTITSSFISCYPLAPNNGLDVQYFTDNPSSAIAPTLNGLHVASSCAASSGAPPAATHTAYGARSTAVFSDANNTIAAFTANRDAQPGNHGNGDGYLANFGKGAKQNWRLFLGGSGTDVLMGVINISETEWLAVGYTSSNDGDVSGNHGQNDWWVVKLGRSNIIKGTVFYDYNTNGIKDNGEPFVNNANVKTNKAALEYQGSTNVDGLFYISVDTGTYVTTVTSPDTNYISVPASHSTSFSSWKNIDSLSFALQPKPAFVRDYKLSVFRTVSGMGNRDDIYSFNISNVGTDTLINRNFIFLKDPRTRILPTTQPLPTVVKGDTVVWTIDTLLPTKTKLIYVNLYVFGSPTVENGTQLNAVAYIDSTGDVRPADNKSNESWTMRSSPMPYSVPPVPAIGGLQASYCSNAGLQKIKITNLPDTFRATRASITLDGMPVLLAADTSFNLSIGSLSPAQHTIQVVYANPGYTKTSNFNFTIVAAGAPDVNVMASAVNITTQSQPVVVKAINAGGGGTSPQFAFAWDRNFTHLIQAESAIDSIRLQAQAFTLGDNWIYVRITSNDECNAQQTGVDSIKIYRAPLISIVDLNNPAVVTKVYPNPFKSIIKIIGLDAGKDYVVHITNIEGRTVYTQTISRQFTAELPAISGAPGVYWLTLFDAAGTRKIVSTQLIKQ